MSFWWSAKPSSPKNNGLDNCGSFSTFEQFTKDAWDIAENSIDYTNHSSQNNVNNLEEKLNKNLHSRQLLSNDKIIDYYPNSISNQPLLLGISSNDNCYNDITAKQLYSSSEIDYTNASYSAKINSENAIPQLQLPISDVHKLAEEIVHLHRLSLDTNVDNRINHKDTNSSPDKITYRRQFSENTISENNNKSIIDNNGSLNNDINQKTKNTLFKNCGRIFGPGIGVRKKDLYSNKLSKCAEEEESKIIKFSQILEASDLDIDYLRKLSWSGIPMQSRADVWKILCGYLPLNADRREAVINRKRLEYLNCVDQYFGTREVDGNKEIYHQIHIDIPRMQVIMKVFQQIKVQEMFERILYTWAIRHPASSYVQGINDLLVPFFVVFLSKHIDRDEELENFEVEKLPVVTLNEVEADSYWCLSRLLDGIQDNYTFAQPGIQRQVNLLKELTARLNIALHEHLVKHQIEYLQFSFRWFNNLLMREIPLHCAIRLWDAFLSEVDGFTQLHLFVCSALLARFSSDILNQEDFQGIMLFLGHLPTEHWTSLDISLLLADAHRLRYLFADTPSHFRDL